MSLVDVRALSGALKLAHFLKCLYLQARASFLGGDTRSRDKHGQILSLYLDWILLYTVQPEFEDRHFECEKHKTL